MSIKKQGKTLGVSHSYLRVITNGKRLWKPELRERYEEIEDTFVTTNEREGKKTIASRKELPLPLEKRIVSR